MEKRNEPVNKIYINPDPDSANDYDDDDIPEIDLPKKTDDVPMKFPRCDFPDGL